MTDFDSRGLPFDKADEYASINYYENVLQAGEDRIRTQLTASKCSLFSALLTAASRAGHMRFTFQSQQAPYIVLDASRESVITSTPSNTTFPKGYVHIDRERQEVYGWSRERQE